MPRPTSPRKPRRVRCVFIVVPSREACGVPDVAPGGRARREFLEGESGPSYPRRAAGSTGKQTLVDFGMTVDVVGNRRTGGTGAGGVGPLGVLGRDPAIRFDGLIKGPPCVVPFARRDRAAPRPPELLGGLQAPQGTPPR